MDKHVVLTSGRSGSNHLVAAINQHPQLCNFGEVLGPWTLPSKLWTPLRFFGASKGSLLQCVYSSRVIYYFAQGWSFGSRHRQDIPTHFRRRSQLKSLGVKDFFMHLRDPKVLAWFHDCENLSIIHLCRKDLLARGLSVLRLNQDGRAVSRAGDSKATTLQVDPHALLNALDALVEEAQEEHEILQQLKHHRCLSLSHEQHFSDWGSTQKSLAEVHRFLSVAPTAIIDTGHRSSVRGRAIESVANRKEVEGALLDSRHAKLLVAHYE